MSLVNGTPEDMAGKPGRRVRIPLAVKFAATVAALVALVLLINGALGLWSSYREARDTALQMQMEKAQAAAGRIDRFVSDLESQLGWTTRAEWQGIGIEQQRYDFTRLLRQAPAITELFYLDGKGVEQLKVSRLGPDSVASLTDHSAEPRFTEAVKARTWFGPVYLRNGSEPSMTIAVAHAGAGVTVAEVNLNTVSEEVAAIKVGETGHAFVVGRDGKLVAHPDSSLVLGARDLSGLPQVAAALAATGPGTATEAESLDGEPVFATYAPIPRLGWTVFVQSPAAETLAPVYSLLWKSALLLAIGLLLAAMAGVWLARRMIAPIGRLQEGVERLAEGDLSQRVAIGTGDEIAVLADRFNTMAGRLQGSQAALKAKAEERSHDLEEALQQQTATADVLKVISHSAVDLNAVLETLIGTAIELCNATRGVIWLRRGEQLYLAAQVGYSDEWIAAVRDIPLTPAPDAQTTSGLAAYTGEIVHVEDVPNDPRFASLAAHKLGDYRAGLAVPLKRDDKVIGVISLSRPEALLFTRRQVALVQTFADQAVIAIENARLFEEVQERNRDVTEALEQQTATAEVLKTISSSAFDLDAVLRTLVQSACDLCHSAMGYIYLRHGDVFQPTLQIGWTPEFHEYMRQNPVRPGRGSVAARVALTAAVVQIPDVLADPEYTNTEGQKIGGFRTVLGVPLMRDGIVMGVFILARSSVSPFSAREVELVQTFSDQAVIAIENVRLFDEVQARTAEVTEALKQQTATGEVLRVIASSPADIRPVLDAVVESAARLCDAYDAILMFRQDGALVTAAHHGPIPADIPSFPVDRDSASGRAVVDRTAIHVHDISVEDKEYPAGQQMALRLGHRTVLGTPLMREDEAIGVLLIRRTEVRPFNEKQIQLLKTFADQAVIAIENARLFDEVQARTADLTEALQQQTATADVLKVISASAFDLDTVLTTLTTSAASLCNAGTSGIFMLRDGAYHISAAIGILPEHLAYERANPQSPRRGSWVGRAAIEKAVVHVPDVSKDAEAEYLEIAKIGGFSAVLCVPLLREGAVIGVFGLTRPEPGPFTERQIELVQTFADQAVIAIENVRLFEEVQARTREVTEALEQQTATGAILQVIAGSPTDIQPVLDAVAESAARLCDAYDATIYLLRSDRLAVGAHHGPIPIDDAGLPLARDIVTGRAVLDRAPVHVHDLTVAGEEFATARTMAQRLGFRAILATPLLQEEKAIGALMIRRTEARAFGANQIDLLKTFANQAVIAIGNVRLFEEVQARTADLSEALQQQTATADVLKVISASAFDLQNVLDTLLESAIRLCRADKGGIARSLDGVFQYVSMHGFPPSFQNEMRANPPVAGRGSAVGRVVEEGTIIQVEDVLLDPDYKMGALAESGGYRTVLAVPLFREAELIGVFVMNRAEANRFNEREIELVTTFADQAVIAIENVRLFDEVQTRTAELSESLKQQTATADVLKAISRSTFDLQPVLDTLVESAAKLCDADKGVIFKRDGDKYRWSANYGNPPELEAFARANPFVPGRYSVTSRVALEAKAIHVTDVLADPEYGATQYQKLGGYRTILCVPILREGAPVGVFALTRSEVRDFTARQIELVETFADQAGIAIENVRLFEEVQARTRELSDSIEELRTAQGRLIQTEKLASLGQLTAGIAHEIKNPLNFVNNFSSLSGELIDELRDILEHAVLDEKTRADIEELADMLKSNLDKVVQHGKRADSIVRNMLLHSREGSGEHRFIDINSVVEESLNLAYHGARAEKQGFNITLQKAFDPEAGVVDLYPQEITRVLLNLISNGFYATMKRGAQGDGAAYEPVLSASTKNFGDRVEIRIRDNGTGIPPEVRAKMFNPFFTTKPAGEGTGLGLSLSHDIVVKQHAGTIEVDTKPGSFTEFRIVLPRSAASLAKLGDPA